MDKRSSQFSEQHFSRQSRHCLRGDGATHLTCSLRQPGCQATYPLGPENPQNWQKSVKNRDTEFNEDDLEIIDDTAVTEIGEITKIKTVPIKEQDKTYKETIQKGDLYNIKLQQYPRAAQDPEFQKKILKEINIITLLKQRVTSTDGGILFPTEDYRPLIAKYTASNFTNQTLIPIVTNKKKIYTNTAQEARELDPKTNEVIPSLYDELSKPIYERDYRTVQTNHESRIANLMNEINPTIANQTDIGFLLRLGQSPYSEVSAASTDNIERFSQNILTIRHCNQHYSCQSIALTSRPFDYQINIGPLCNFIEMDKEGVPQSSTSDDISSVNLLNIPGEYRILYPGDMINIVGFLRLPLDTDIATISTTIANTTPIILPIDSLDEDFIPDSDKTYLYMLPDTILDSSAFQDAVSKIVPSFQELLTASYSNDLNEIYNYLRKFNYDENQFTEKQRQSIVSQTDIQLATTEQSVSTIEDKLYRPGRFDVRHLEKVGRLVALLAAGAVQRGRGAGQPAASAATPRTAAAAGRAGCPATGARRRARWQAR